MQKVVFSPGQGSFCNLFGLVVDGRRDTRLRNTSSAHFWHPFSTFLLPAFLRESLFYQKKSPKILLIACVQRRRWKGENCMLEIRCVCVWGRRRHVSSICMHPSVHYLVYTWWWGGAAKASRVHDRLPVHHGASINTNTCINIHVRAIIVTSWPVLLGKPEYVEGNRTDMAERLWPELEARISSRWSDSANRCIAAPASLCTSALVWKKKKPIEFTSFSKRCGDLKDVWLTQSSKAKAETKSSRVWVLTCGSIHLIYGQGGICHSFLVVNIIRCL